MRNEWCSLGVKVGSTLALKWQITCSLSCCGTEQRTACLP